MSLSHSTSSRPKHTASGAVSKMTTGIRVSVTSSSEVADPSSENEEDETVPELGPGHELLVPDSEVASFDTEMICCEGCARPMPYRLAVDSRLGTEQKFSIKELEEIYLARRSRELNVEAGKQEEELGRHLASCMHAINALRRLHKEAHGVRERQFLVSNGASQLRPFEYEWEMQQRITLFDATSPDNRRRRHQPSITPMSRKLRLIGHTFYAEPSLLSVSFNRLWNRLWSRA